MNKVQLQMVMNGGHVHLKPMFITPAKNIPEYLLNFLI